MIGELLSTGVTTDRALDAGENLEGKHKPTGFLVVIEGWRLKLSQTHGQFLEKEHNL